MIFSANYVLWLRLIFSFLKLPVYWVQIFLSDIWHYLCVIAMLFMRVHLWNLFVGLSMLRGKGEKRDYAISACRKSLPQVGRIMGCLVRAFIIVTCAELLYEILLNCIYIWVVSFLIGAGFSSRLTGLMDGMDSLCCWKDGSLLTVTAQ